MANFVYTPYRNSAIGKTADYAARVDLDTDTIKATFNDEGTTAALATHVFLSTYTAANPAYTAPPPTLGSPTVGVVAAGVFNAATITFTGASVLTGSTSQEDLIIYKDGGTAAASPVLMNFNTGVTGLPITPNGADVTVVWNASGIMQF